MAKSKSQVKNQNGGKGKSGGGKIQHRFKVRDIVMNDVSAKSVGYVSTDGTGTAAYVAILAPYNLSAAVLNSGVYTSPAIVAKARLPWLYNQATNFGYYRVISASLVFVSNQGQNVSGQVNMFTSRDASDLMVGSGLQSAYTSGAGVRTFDLSNAGSREQKIPMLFDSSWKKVSGVLSIPGNASGLSGSTAQVVNVNSINDLAFGCLSVQVIGGPASATIGSMYIDYEVEFRDPMSVGLNG